MYLKKLTLSLSRVMFSSFVLIALTIGCKKTYKDVIGAERHDYLIYSGTKVYVTDVVKQLTTIDTTLSFLSATVKEDSILWDKSILVAKPTKTKTGRNLRCVVPYINKSSNVEGYLKLGIDTAGKIIKVEVIPDRKFIDKNVSEKTDEIKMYQRFKSGGLKIGSSTMSAHQAFLSKTTSDLVLPPVTKNNQSVTCYTKFDLEITADYWICGVGEFNNFLSQFSYYVQDKLSGAGYDIHPYADGFQINDIYLTEQFMNAEMQRLIADFSQQPFSSVSGSVCNSGSYPQIEIENYYSTCENGDPTPPTEECKAYVQSVMQQSSVADVLLSSDITDVDAAHREIRFSWVFFSGPLNVWRYVSRDLGVQNKVNGVWQWVSFTHQSVTLEGTTTGYTLSYTDKRPPVTVVSANNASVELFFNVRLTSYCAGVPFETDITVTGTDNVRKIFPVNN